MAAGLRSIGQVMTLLKPEHPELSITKIRFLESEGLLAPARAPSGYRRYSDADIERLRYVLDVQKNHYLPLKVIREHLDMMDKGLEPPALDSKPEPQTEVVVPAVVGQSQPKRSLRISRQELLSMSGLPEAQLIELERHQLLAPRRGTGFYGRDALTIAVVARKLGVFGMDARHLRLIKQSAEREVGLIEQAVAPYMRRSGNPNQVTADVMKLVLHAHAAMMRQSMVRG